MKLYNDKNDHFLCHYTLVIDSFSKFCDIGCVYCYAKEFGPEQRTAISLPNLEKVFIKAFEQKAGDGLSQILRKKIPVRLGFETDPFQDLEKKTNITFEMLKLFKKYEYPYIIFTKSPLCLEKKYLELYDPKLTYIQISISSTDEEMEKRLEPKAVSVKERIKIVKELEARGIDTALRFNLLPQSLHQIENNNYYERCLDFIANAAVKKVILNRISIKSKDSDEVIQFPFNPKQFEEVKKKLASTSTVTLCYLGSPSLDYFNYYSKECDNCCQCDLSPGNKTTALPVFLSTKSSLKEKTIHSLRMSMLKILAFTLKKGSS